MVEDLTLVPTEEQRRGNAAALKTVGCLVEIQSNASKAESVTSSHSKSIAKRKLELLRRSETLIKKEQDLIQQQL